ncbi:MAG: hypothetical protein FJZ04_00795 [Candidatus Moranbacteria bacterium]|nr:hypothetical protein [Candidatus Moranbacteria bacterium]
MYRKYLRIKSKQVKRAVFVFIIALFTLFWLVPFFWGNKKMLPRVYLGDNALSKVPLEGVQEKINTLAREYEEEKFTLFFRGKKAESSLVDIGAKIEKNKTGENLIKSLALGSYTPKFFWRFWQNLVFGYRVPVFYSFDQERFSDTIGKKLGQGLFPAEDASVIFLRTGVKVIPSKEGSGVDESFVVAQLVKNIKDWKVGNVEIKIIKIAPAVTTQEAENLKNKIENIITYPFVFKAREVTLSLKKDELLSWIKITKEPLLGNSVVGGETDMETTINTTLSGNNFTDPKQKYQLSWDVDREKITRFLDEKIKGKIYQEKINGVLAIENGALVEVQPSRGEITVDIEKALDIVIASFKNSQYFIELPVVEIPAAVSLKKAQELGVNNLMGTGESNFTGSPTNRRHNIRVGAGKFNGAVIGEGETFSFLKTLGPVDKSTGYLPELVIKKDKTIPEYGGGMCQVSSTCFRAAVNSGLRVVERQNHAYPVQYYSPQGTDATVYIPRPDLKFVNDTPGPILIQTRIEGNLLFFDFFGQKDGRRVELEGPRTWDKKPDGSMKAEWIQRVYDKDSKLMFQKNFLSKYESPSKFPHPEDEKPPKEKKKKKKKD